MAKTEPKNAEKIVEKESHNDDQSSTARIIKKYPNRRLYDTHQSCYITLDDLSNLVRTNIEVRVIDAKTGKDMTRSTLAQIIFENEGHHSSLLPTEFLRQLICLYGKNTPTLLSSYLQEAITHFTRHQEDMKNMMSQGGFWPMNDLGTLNKKQMEFLRNSMRFFLPNASHPKESDSPTPKESDPPTTGDSSQHIRELEKRIADLQQQLERKKTAS